MGATVGSMAGLRERVGFVVYSLIAGVVRQGSKLSSRSAPPISDFLCFLVAAVKFVSVEGGGEPAQEGRGSLPRRKKPSATRSERCSRPPLPLVSGWQEGGAKVEKWARAHLARLRAGTFDISRGLPAAVPYSTWVVAPACGAGGVGAGHACRSKGLRRLAEGGMVGVGWYQPACAHGRAAAGSRVHARTLRPMTHAPRFGRGARQQVEVQQAAAKPAASRGCAPGGGDGGEDRGAFVVDCGDRVGAWRCKCFQAAVLGCCRGFVRRRLKKLFVRLCANDRGSGLGATVVEACNFKAVVEALAREQKFVWVVEAECYDAPAAGKWRLGLPGARCLGTLLWLRSERRVVKLMGAGALAAVRGAPLCRAGSAPREIGTRVFGEGKAPQG